MSIAHEQEYQLRTGDFDRRQELMPASVLDVFQDIAGVSAEKTPGMELATLAERGLFWAVTQTMYEVVRTPALHERVIAQTWPLAPTRMGFQREYTIRALDGELLVKGTSQWVMMERATRALASAKEAYDGPMDFSEEKNFPKRVRRVRAFEPDDEPQNLQTAWCDVDLNGHVNNTKYANFFLDVWNPGEDEHIKTFQIDYRHEIHAGELVSIGLKREPAAEDAPATVLAEGRGEDGRECFYCRATLA